MTANGIVDVVEQQLAERVVGVAIAVVVGDEVAWARGFGRLDVTRPELVTTIAGGWIRARLELEVIGFGYIVLFTRLGLVEERLEGLIYARNDSGEIAMVTSLDRPSQSRTHST